MFRLNIHSKIHGECYKEFETEELVLIELANLRASQHFGVEESVEIIPATEENPEQTIVHEGSVSYEIIDLTAKVNQEKINKEAQDFLDSTDFKILRHIRQQALGIDLSLSPEEYLALERERHMASQSIVK